MKRFCFFSGGITIALAVIGLVFTQPVLSQNTDLLDVAEAVISWKRGGSSIQR